MSWCGGLRAWALCAALLALAGAALALPELTYPRVRPVHQFTNTALEVSNLTVANDRLPPCSSIEYELLVDEKARPVEGQQAVFILEFFPRTSDADPFVPPHDDAITVTLSYGAQRTPIAPSSIITEADVRFADGSLVTYLGSGVQQCEIVDEALVRGPAPPFDVACGVTYYCNGVAAAAEQLFVTVSTGENETPEGILYDFRVTLRNLPVQALEANTPFHEEAVLSPPGVLLYKPTVAQYHYVLHVEGPDGSDEDAVRWAWLASPLTELVVTVDSLRITEDAVRTNETQGVWSLSLNVDDVAVVNRGLFGGGYADVPVTGGTGQDMFFSPQQCFLANDEVLLMDSDQALRVETGGCLSPGAYFVAVGMSDLPQYNDTLYSYRVRAAIQALPDQGIPVPAYLQFGLPVSDKLSPAEQLPAQVSEHYYVLPRPSQPDSAEDSLVLTIYNVYGGSVDVEITTGGFGFQAGCDSVFVAACSDVSDRCTVQLDACAYTNALRFVTVQAHADDGSEFVQYSLTAAERFESDTLKAVSALSRVSDAPKVWEEASEVAGRGINHYVLALPLDAIRDEHVLTVEVYQGRDVGALEVSYGVGGLLHPCGADAAGSCTGGSCVFAFNHCELIDLLSEGAVDDADAESAVYFAVRSVQPDANTDPFVVDYTVRFTLWERAVELHDGVTVSSTVFATGYTSQQFRLAVPDEVAASLGPYDHVQLRVRVHNVDLSRQGDALLEGLTAEVHGGCGRPAGACPCFTSDRVQRLADSSVLQLDAAGTFYSDFVIPACECDAGEIYVSFRMAALSGSPRISFDVTPFVDVVRGSALPAGGGSVSGYLFADNDDAFNLVGHVAQTAQDRQHVWYFADALYAWEYDAAAQPAGAVPELRVELDYVQHRAGPHAITAVVVVARDVLPQLGGPRNSSLERLELELGPGQQFVCGSACHVVQAEDSSEGSDDTRAGYCVQVVRPCELQSGTYYMRVYAVSQRNGEADRDLVLDDYALDFTLTAQLVDTAPVRVAVGVPSLLAVRFNEYRHTVFTLPEDVASALVRAYIHEQDASTLGVFLNPHGPAGAAPCLDAVTQCTLSPDAPYCQFDLDACRYSAIGAVGGRDYYVSVLGSGTASGAEGTQATKHRFDRSGVEVTLEVVADTAELIDVREGAPRTVQLDGAEAKLFAFDVTEEDAAAGAILHVEAVDARSSSGGAVQYITSVGRDVCASDRSFVGNFKAEEYACTLGQYVGRWYLRVHLFHKDVNFTPLSEPSLVTLRVYWTDVPIVPLPVVPTTPGREPAFTAVPQPLDFCEWVHYRVELSDEDALDNTDRVIAVEIADLTDNLNAYSKLENVDAWLSIGSFPAPANVQSVFSAAGAPSCFYDHRLVRNNLGPETSTVMARFPLSLCTAGVCAAAGAVDPSADIYLTVRPNMLGPEPSIALRANFSVRAFSVPVERPAGALFEGSLTEYRGRVLSGETFTFVEPERVVVECDDRWGSVVQRPFYFKTTPLFHESAYERATVHPPVTNTVQLVGSWNAPFSDVACACGQVNSTEPECGRASCSPIDSQDVFYGALMFKSCRGGRFSELVAGQQLVLRLLDDRSYVEEERPVTLAPNSAVTARLEAGRYRQFVLDLGAAGFNQKTSIVTLQFTFNEGSVDTNVCFEAGRVGTTFPGDDQSSYCPRCTPPSFAELTIEPCCAESDVFVYTVFGAHNVSVADFTLRVTSTAIAEASEVFSLGDPLPAGAPVTVPTRATGANLYRFYSFTLTPEVFSPDDVVTFYVGPRDGDATTRRVFLQKSDLAGDPAQSSCFSSWFDRECDNVAAECHLQIPYCTWAANGGYGLYYLGVQAPAAGAAGENIRVFVQPTELVELGAGPSPRAAVPLDASTRPVDYYYRHFKIPIRRDLGDVGLELERARVAVTVSRLAGNARLQLSLRSSRNGGSGTPLAGDPAVQYSDLLQSPGASCDVALDDAEWVCERRDPTSGFTTPGFMLPVEMSNDATLSEVVCTARLCSLFEENPYLDTDAFVYAAVRDNTPAGGRSVTEFTVSAAVVYDELDDLAVGQFTLRPSTEPVEARPYEECTIGGGAESTACHAEDVPTTLEALYATVPLDALELRAGDYLTVNMTGLTEFLQVAAWLSFECEPDTADSVLCGAPDGCLIELGDPANGLTAFTAVGSDGPRRHASVSVIVRVRPLGATFDANTDFDLEVLLQRPAAHSVALPLPGTWEQKYAVWDDHYLMLTLELPQHLGDYELSVFVTAACTDAPPEVFRSYFGYTVAAESSAEAHGFAPFNETLTSTQLNGGNYYLTLRGREVKYPGVELGKFFGRVTPQTEVTVRAVVEQVAVRTLQPNDRVEYTAVAGVPVTYVMDVAGYDVRSSILISHSGSADAVVRIALPDNSPMSAFAFVREVDAELVAWPGSDQPVSGAFTLSGEQEILLDVGVGRWYVSVRPNTTAAVQGELRTEVRRVDVQPIALAADGTAHLWSELPRTASNQWFSFATDESTEFVSVSLTTYGTGCPGQELSMSLYDSDCADTSCFADSCSVSVENNNATCTVRDGFCTSDVGYTVQVQSFGGFGCDCDPATFQLEVSTRDRFAAIGSLEIGQVLLGELLGGQGDIGGIQRYEVDLSGVAEREYATAVAEVCVRGPPSNFTAIDVFLSGRPRTTTCIDELCGSRFVIKNESTAQSCEEVVLDCGVPERLFLQLETLGETVDFSVVVRVDDVRRVELDAAAIGVHSAPLDGEATVFMFNGGVTSALRSLSASAAVLLEEDPGAPLDCECTESPCEIHGGLRNYAVKMLAGAVTDECGDVAAAANVFDYEVLPVGVVASTSRAAPWELRTGEQALLAYEVPDAEHVPGVRIVFTQVEGQELRVIAGCDGFVTLADGNECAPLLFDEPFGSSVPGLNEIELRWDELLPAEGPFGVRHCSTVHLAVTQNNPADCPSDVAGDELTLFNVYAVPLLADARIDFDLGLEAGSAVVPLDGPLTDPISDAVVEDGVLTHITIAAHQDPHVRVYRVEAGDSGFVHVGVAQVNGTDGITITMRPSLPLPPLSAGFVNTTKTCSYGNPAEPIIALSTDADLLPGSCFVHAIAEPGQSFLVEISTSPTVTLPVVTFQLKLATAYKPLTSAWTRGLLQGDSRQYYQVPARGACGDFHAVTLQLEVLSGPRVLLQWSSRPEAAELVDLGAFFVDAFSESKSCPHGVCTLEIASREGHPRADTLYVWVSALPEDDLSFSDVARPLEQPTHYRLRAYTGAENCGALPDDEALAFCGAERFSTRLNETLFYRPWAAAAADRLAELSFDRFSECRCPTATAACRSLLRDFACEDAMRECDACGYPVVPCRDECVRLEAECGAWNLNGVPDTCECDLSALSCQVAGRYADAEPCSGTLTPPPPPTPTPTPAPPPTPTPTPDVAPTSGTVELQIDFAGRQDTAAVLCSESELARLISDVLVIPLEFIEVVEVEAAVATVRIDGCCGRTATELAVELVNLARFGGPEVDGTCIGSAVVTIVAPEPSVVDTIPELIDLTSSTGSDSTFTLEESTTSTDDLRIVVNIISDSSAAFTAVPVVLALAAATVALLF